MKRVMVWGLVLTGMVLGSELRAQVDEEDTSLNGRFQYVRTKSQTYNDYKVIKITTLDALWRATMDTLKAERSQIASLGATISEKDKEIKTLQAQMKELEASVEGLVHDSKHIAVLGMDIRKGAFNVTVLVMLLGLGGVIGFLYIKAARCTSIAQNKSRAFEKLHHDFEEYKRSALEKQMRLRRELQTERNKWEEMGR
jgi:hypothetical protein